MALSITVLRSLSHFQAGGFLFISRMDEKVCNQIFYKYLRWQKYDDLSLLAEQYDITEDRVRIILYDTARKKGVNIITEKVLYRAKHEKGKRKRCETILKDPTLRKKTNAGNEKKKKLSKTDVQYIIENSDQLSSRKLAQKFQVDKKTILNVLHKKTYKEYAQKIYDQKYIRGMNNRFQKFMSEKYKGYRKQYNIVENNNSG